MASITIPLYYDLDLLLWTSAAGGIARQPNLVLGQSDSIAFAVQFVRSGVVIELTAPQFICGIKPINDVAGDYLCQTTTVVKTGSTTSTVYTFTLLLDSDELRAWLLTVTAVSNYAAFSIRDTVNLIATLPAITCTILPDYTLEGTTPTAASGTLIVGSGQTFTVSKSFAMPTDNGTDTYILQTNGAGVGSWVAKAAGAGTVTNVAVTTANGVSGTVANPTASAAITLTLGAITPTSSTVSGNVSVGGDLIATSLKSTTGNQTLLLLPVASSVNYIAVEPSVTGSPPHIYAQGADTNIGLHLSPKGTGYVNIQDGNTDSKRLRFGASGNLANVTTTIESSSTTSQTITLPNATTATTLAGLQMVQTFSAAQTFSSTVSLTLDTDATSSTVGGTLTVTGGAAVSKKLFVGTLLDLVATTATAGQITQAGTRLLHTYGTNNLFVGLASGKTSGTIGSGNVGLGRDALTSITSGTNNTCLGDQSGYFVSSGSSNMLIGNTAGVGISTGSQNIAMGVAALRYITSNGDCTAIGHQALYYTTGQKNTGIGSNACWTCTSGSKNTFIGEYAGASTDTIGLLTGIGITTGSNNTMLGQNTASTTAAGNYRTAIGSESRCNADSAIKLGRDTLDRVIFPSWTADPASDLVVGMVIFRSDTSTLKVYTSTGWKTITAV